MNNPKSTEIPLTGIQWTWVIDVNGKDCGFGEFTDKSAANPLGKIKYNSARLIKKVEGRVTTWKLNGVKNSFGTSCKNDMEFKVDKNGKFIELPSNKHPVISEYAKHSCTIKSEGASNKSRELTDSEADAIATCYEDKDNHFWDYQRKYGSRTLENIAGTGTGIAVYCGKYLFEDSKPARLLDCSRSFMRMGVGVRRSVIGKTIVKNEVHYCEAKLSGFGAGADPTVICPYGIKANISIDGHSSAFFSKGFCSSIKFNDNCVKVEEMKPSDLMGGDSTPPPAEAGLR